MLRTSAVIIDSSTLINLAATSNLPEILRSLSETCIVCGEVADREALFIRSEDGTQTEQINVQSWIEQGALQNCTPNEMEEEEFVNFAALIDDGEAMCLAIAKSRGWSLATDDRKGSNLARAAGVDTVTTAEIMQAWSGNRPKEQLVAALLLIETRARYRPPAESNLYDWWMNNTHP